MIGVPIATMHTSARVAQRRERQRCRRGEGTQTQGQTQGQWKEPKGTPAECWPWAPALLRGGRDGGASGGSGCHCVRGGIHTLLPGVGQLRALQCSAVQCSRVAARIRRLEQPSFARRAHSDGERMSSGAGASAAALT